MHWVRRWPRPLAGRSVHPPTMPATAGLPTTNGRLARPLPPAVAVRVACGAVAAVVAAVVADSVRVGRRVAPAFPTMHQPAMRVAAMRRHCARPRPVATSAASRRAAWFRGSTASSVDPARGSVPAIRVAWHRCCRGSPSECVRLPRASGPARPATPPPQLASFAADLRSFPSVGTTGCPSAHSFRARPTKLGCACRAACVMPAARYPLATARNRPSSCVHEFRRCGSVHA